MFFFSSAHVHGVLWVASSCFHLCTCFNILNSASAVVTITVLHTYLRMCKHNFTSAHITAHVHTELYRWTCHFYPVSFTCYNVTTAHVHNQQFIWPVTIMHVFQLHRWSNNCPCAQTNVHMCPNKKHICTNVSIILSQASLYMLT